MDVGGGLGQDLEELKVKRPGIWGRLVLHNQPEVIGQISLHEELAGRDLGARAYHLHFVLHDWDDASCLKILWDVLPTMQLRYSKLLVKENMIRDVGMAGLITSMDWLMMVLGAVGALLGQAGMEVIKIWTYE